MRGYWLFVAGLFLMFGWKYAAGTFLLFASVSD
jgi:hypothetical protein